MAGQVCRSGPSIPHNMEEAKAALTLADTLTKTGIARKEAAETRRSLMVIRDAELLPKSEAEELRLLITEGNEITAMLSAGTYRLHLRITKESKGRDSRTSWPDRP